LTIQTNRLTVQDGGRVSVLHEGTGNAGRLEIDAESVFLERSGRISASTASGKGGDIELNVQDLLLVRSSSQIAAEAGGTGDGGNLIINTNLLALLDNSKISADAFKGKGGNVQISAQGLVVSPDSAITASSQLGIDGVVTINTLDVDLNSGFVELPTEVIDPSQQIIAGCPADRGNVFVIAGRGGLPPNPTQLLQQQGTWQDWRFLDNRDDRSPVGMNQESSAIADERTFQEDDTEMQGHTDAARNVSQDPHPDGNVQSRVPEHKSSVVEAAGWIINPSGQVQLVAQMPEAATQGSWYRSPQCAG
jgi:large exoprotein involved in heme utilization and adhesion